METEGEVVEPNESVVLRKKIGGWVLITFGVLLSYVFVYPIILFSIEPIWDRWEWVDDVVEFSVVPLDYLHESVPAYRGFIDWIDSIIIP